MFSSTLLTRNARLLPIFSPAAASAAGVACSVAHWRWLFVLASDAALPLYFPASGACPTVFSESSAIFHRERALTRMLVQLYSCCAQGMRKTQEVPRVEGRGGGVGWGARARQKLPWVPPSVATAGMLDSSAPLSNLSYDVCTPCLMCLLPLLRTLSKRWALAALLE